MPVAGKTGKTTSNKDLWFCGFTPYYTCAVWGGYDDNKQCNSDTSFRFRLWKGIMERIHEELPYRDFEMPASVERKSVCRLTGMLARSGCPTVTEYFDMNALPDEVCTGHGNVYDGDDEEDEEDEKTDNEDEKTDDEEEKPKDNDDSSKDKPKDNDNKGKDKPKDNDNKGKDKPKDPTPSTPKPTPEPKPEPTPEPKPEPTPEPTPTPEPEPDSEPASD